MINEKRLNYAKSLNVFLPYHLPTLRDAYSEQFGSWSVIDKSKDKSLSAGDFRFWLYLRLLDEKFPMKQNEKTYHQKPKK